jgi:hypothetical protein
MMKTIGQSLTTEERETRQLEKLKKIEKLARLRDSYAVYIMQHLRLILGNRESQEVGFASVEEAYTPATEEVDGERVYLHRAAQMFWAGLDEDGEPVDPTEGDERLSKVMFLQGLRKAGQKVPDPTYLPGGVTTTDIVRERLADKGYGLQLAFSKGKLSVIVIWNHDAWHQRLAKVRAEKAKRVMATPSEPVPVQISLEEYKANKVEAVTAVPTLDDGWCEVPVRKGKVKHV